MELGFNQFTLGRLPFLTLALPPLFPQAGGLAVGRDGAVALLSTFDFYWASLDDHTASHTSVRVAFVVRRR